MKNFTDLYEVSEDGCWLWKGGRASMGRYGCLKVDGKTVSAHRYSYQIHVGEIPEGMFICHHCDVPLCVNPEHLFAGTAKQNYDDMIQKGRGPDPFIIKDETGEKNANAKLSDEEILEIRRLRASGSSYRHLKARFGIKSNGHVRNIITGKLWGHLPLLAGSAGR